MLGISPLVGKLVSCWGSRAEVPLGYVGLKHDGFVPTTRGVLGRLVGVAFESPWSSSTYSPVTSSSSSLSRVIELIPRDTRKFPE